MYIRSGNVKGVKNVIDKFQPLYIYNSMKFAGTFPMEKFLKKYLQENIEELLKNAAERGDLEAVKYALGNKAQEIGLAARKAGSKGQMKILEYLNQEMPKYYKKEEYDLFYSSVVADATGNKDVVDYVLQNGFNPNIVLSYAISEDSLDNVIDILDRYDFDINEYALIYAIEVGEPQLVELLLAYGAKTGKETFKVAKEFGNKRILSLLEKYKTDKLM